MNIRGTNWKIFTFTMCYCVVQARGVRFLPSTHQYRFFKSVELHWLTFYMDLFHSGTPNLLCMWIPRDFSRFSRSPEICSLRLILKFHIPTENLLIGIRTQDYLQDHPYCQNLAWRIIRT